MSQQPQLRLLQEQKRRWQWPLDLASYDRAPLLSHAEQQALDQFVVLYEHVIPSPSQRLDLSEDALSRLLCPMRDVLTVTGADVRACNLAVWFLLRQMHRRRAAFWAWSNTEWIEILCPSSALFGHQHHVNGTYCRPYALAVAYLLCNFTPGMALGTVHYHSFAIKVFGKPLVEQAIKRVSDPLLQWGHGTDVVISLPNELSKLLVWNRSPQVEDLTYAFLDQIRQGEGTALMKDWMPMVSRALVDLGILERPLPLKNEAPRFGKWIETADVAPVWVDYCNRWYATTTASLRTKKHMYYRILRIGRWVTAFHPEMASPLDWTRETAAECVAEICRMKVGEWINVTEIQVPKQGLALQPRSKGALLAAMSAFFQDGQEWGWFPRRFDARRCFALPRAIKALIGPQPRVIQDDVWAKLVWAGLNLTAEDLPQTGAPYPIEMVRAMAITWLFAGLRSDEFRRLRRGCVRWQQADVSITETEEALAKKAVCWLDIPVNKTSTAFTKAVDRVVGEAIEAWEQARPVQPARFDPKTGEVVDYLFMFRGQQVGKRYLNVRLIPYLCRKAGVPEADARGNITSHRARSTIATQLYNAKEPLTLFELQAWLGHHSPATTQHYAKITPTKLAKAYEKAGYFGRNIRTIEVLIDQDAIKSGAAAKGEPWRFFDLGHGYCLYEFFDACPHRMACARCSFYRPKGSTQAQLLEGKTNLLHMLQEIPLNEEERAAVEDGIEAMEKLCQQLADVPTPAGPTPQQLSTKRQETKAIIPLEVVRRTR